MTNSDTITESATNNAALLAAGAALGHPLKSSHKNATDYAMVPNGYQVEELPFKPLPDRSIASVKLRDAASFVHYFKNHKQGYSSIYATLEPAKFLAVFDDFFHASTPTATADGTLNMTLLTDEQANWREFRAEFSPPASREWLLWNKTHNVKLTQLQFAEFLQDNLPDVIKPTGAELYELALNFESTQSGVFSTSQRLQDGSSAFTYTAENNIKGTLQLPEFITLNIPVFENTAPRELQARLRYRAKDGALTLWFELVRPHKVLEAAFRETWEKIATETGITILLGTPE